MVAGRKLDSLWDHAYRSDKEFKCRFCSKDFKGGVVRLRYHLSGVSGGGIQICSKVSEEAKNDALLSLNTVNKKRKTEPSSSDSDGGSSEICVANCNSEVGYSLAKFFLMVGINHNMVESSSFTSLVKALSPGSVLPNSVELESKLIPSFKTEVEQYVSDAKKSWKETGCTLIPIFELNEKEGRSFLSIFGCAKERTVLLNTFEVPNNIDLVAPFLEETVHSVVQSGGSLNIVQCVVDGSKYGESFSKLLCSKFPHVCLTNCAAREVQLMFEEICQDVGWVRITFTVIKSIVDYICSDKAILALMSKYANGRELKQSVDLNLLSTYKMLESILEVKEHLVQLVRSPEWLASGYGAGQRGSEATAYIEDSKTWELGEKLQKGLRSLSQVLCSVDFHDSSSGYLYGLMEIVEHSISQIWKNNQDMYQRFWDIYRLKKGKILSEFHIAAAFLNPAYMRTEQAKNVDSNPVIGYIMGRFIPEGDQEDFVNEVYEYRKILSDGSKLYETTAAKTYHPCQWWETFGQKLPILRNLAIRISSQSCSTSTCKRSMRTVEAVLVKEQRELARGITDLDLKMNAILMERFKKYKSCEREKIVLEEFSKQMSNNGESTSRPLRQLKLCFMTVIASPIRTSQNVEGEKGCRIHIFLEDPTTGRVVQDGIPSTLPLTISVLDGHFSNEASSEEHGTREYFNRNELLGECPYITGDLGVTLNQGEGTLGKFSFNYSSVDRESGQFRLAVKTHTGVCGGFRILEAISNAFTVEDAEEVSPELPVANVDPQNGSFSSNPGEYWVSNIDPLIENEYGFPLGQWFDTPYYPLQGSDQSLAQTAARRVKKKALTWQLQSRGRRRTLKRGSQALKIKSRGEEVLEPKREVYSTGNNNVNGQEVGEENDEPMGLEVVDSLSCCSTSAVARDSISPKPECPTMTLFGVRVAASSSGTEPPISATPAHPSTALQLSTSARGTNVDHQKEDGKAMTLKDLVPLLHSTSIKKMKGEKTRQAHIRWLKVKAVMIWWTVVRRAAARRRTIKQEGGEEDDVHRSTTMSMEVRQHSTMNQQEDRKRLKEDLMHMALQECCLKEDFPLQNSDIVQGSINPISDSLAATHIPLQITTNAIEPTKEDGMPVQIKACEQEKMDSSDFSYSVTPFSVSIGQHTLYDNEDNPSASPDLEDLKLFGRLNDLVLTSKDKGSAVVISQFPKEKPLRSIFEIDCVPLWGSMSLCGKRPWMEDAVAAKPRFLRIPIKMLIEDHTVGGLSQSLTHVTSHFYGVYDGHGGAEVANYCRDRVHFALAEQILDAKDDSVDEPIGRRRQVQWERTFTNCFQRVDDEIGGKVIRGITEDGDSSFSSSLTCSEPLAPETAGSTAVVALICSSHIIVANCGDSRAVLLRGKESMALSIDHRPDLESEYSRIEAAGGKIIQWNGYRVFGVLATSRSIGDRYLKPWIIPEPEVTFIARARDDEVLVIASDGLWDVMTNEEVCKAARNRILTWHKKNGSTPSLMADRGQGVDPASQSAAEFLVKVAMEKGSKDNISVIVVDLKVQRKFKTKS